MIDLKPAPKAARQRFLTLDALRGVAAFFVVALHSGQHLHALTPRFGYLAVDLFFLISGFVLAYAFDRRFQSGLSVQEFLFLRFKRLAPLYGLGLLAGFLGQLAYRYPDLAGSRLWVATALNALALPSPYHSPYMSAFPLNDPFWSLFFEFWVANLALALLWKYLNLWTLFAIVLVSACGLLLAEKTFYTVNVGYSLHTLLAGLARVGFSFFGGVALARLHAVRPPKLRIPSSLLVAVFCVVMLLPIDGRPAHLFELLAVLVVFPALVFWGAEAVEARPAVGKFLGDVSYAAYAVHFPLVILAADMIGTPTSTYAVAAQVVIITAVIPISAIAGFIDERLRHSSAQKIRVPTSPS